MPNKTIYISPENEPLWENFKTQSGSMNSWLTSNANTLSGAAHVASASLGKDSVTTGKSLDSAIGERELSRPVPEFRSLDPTWKPCKHGYLPENCRFAKNGKPCK